MIELIRTTSSEERVRPISVRAGVTDEKREPIERLRRWIDASKDESFRITRAGFGGG